MITFDYSFKHLVNYGQAQKDNSDYSHICCINSCVGATVSVLNNQDGQVDSLQPLEEALLGSET